MPRSLRETAHRLCIALLCVILSAGQVFAGSMTLLGAGGPAVTGSPMVTPLLALAGNNAGPSTSAANFGFLNYGRAGGAWAGTDVARKNPISVPGTITSLNVNFPAGDGSGVWSVGLMQNGTLTTLQCVTTTATTPSACTNSNSVTVAAGDLLDWQVCPGVFTAGSCVPGTAPTAATFNQISASFTSTNGGEGFLIAAGGTTAPSTTVANYFGFGGTTAYNATEAIVSGLAATGGTIDHLYVSGQTAPGAAPKQYVATVFKNGTATGVACIVTGASTTTCNSPAAGTDVAFTVAAGDTISIELCPGTQSGSGGSCTPANTPTGSVYHASVRWKPTIPGEMMSFDTMATAQGTTGTAFDYLNGGSNTTNGETNVCNVAPVGMTIKKLNVAQSTAPGGATTRTITLRGGTCVTQASVGTPGNLSCTVASAATTCSDTTNSFGATANSFLDWQVTATGTNAAMTWFKIGSVVTSP